MTICYVTANTGYSGIIAASEDRRKVEIAMHEWCKERNIIPEYYHGDYRFQMEAKVGNVGGWLRFEEVETI